MYAEFRLIRAILLTHVLTGLLAVILLLLHQIFLWAGAAFIWYGATLLALTALPKRSSFRIVMATLFVLFSLSGIYFLAQVAPHLQPENPPLLSHGLLSVWLGLANSAYGIGGLFFIFSTRVRKVMAAGFSLW